MEITFNKGVPGQRVGHSTANYKCIIIFTFNKVQCSGLRVYKTFCCENVTNGIFGAQIYSTGTAPHY